MWAWGAWLWDGSSLDSSATSSPRLSTTSPPWPPNLRCLSKGGCCFRTEYFLERLRYKLWYRFNELSVNKKTNIASQTFFHIISTYSFIRAKLWNKTIMWHVFLSCALRSTRVTHRFVIQPLQNSPSGGSTVKAHISGRFWLINTLKTGL